MLLGLDADAQVNYPADGPPDEADISGWLHDEIPKGKDSRPDKKKGPKKGSKKGPKGASAAGGGGSILDDLPDVRPVLPDATKPSVFTFREPTVVTDEALAAAGDGSRPARGRGDGEEEEEEARPIFAEVRIRGQGYTSHELRSKLPPALHVLLVGDGSDEKARGGGAKGRGRGGRGADRKPVEEPWEKGKGGLVGKKRVGGRQGKGAARSTIISTAALWFHCFLC